MAKNTEAEALDLEALKEQLKQELLKEMKSEAAQAAPASAMSEEQRAAEEYLNELVEIRLFKDGKDYKDDLVIHINGRNVAIKRGVPVKVPRKFALVIEAHERQDVYAAEYSAAKQGEYDAMARAINI